MTKSIAEILDKAADLIEPEGAWIQGASARGRSGRAVSTARYAVCFCASGAINAARGVCLDHILTASDIVNDVLGWGEILPGWNDTTGRTQAEVVAKLREAAALAREQGK